MLFLNNNNSYAEDTATSKNATAKKQELINVKESFSETVTRFNIKGGK